MKLVINADDYGYTQGVTEGILYAHLHGIVTSTTVLTNSENLELSYEKSKECPDLAFGVHLTLTLGKPLTNGQSFIDEKGQFLSRKALDFSKLDPTEVYNEWKAQIERFITVFQRKPTHLDSHHSVHDQKETYPITQRLCQEYGLECRRHGPFQFVAGFYGDNVSVDNLLHILEEHQHDEAIEIMSHTGYCDSQLRKMSSYTDGRLAELNVLCDPRVKDYIKQHHIELTTY